MKRERSLFIFKVKGQISRSLRLYKEFWHLDPCGQDIARTILNIERGRSLLIFKVKGHISRSLGLYNSGTWILVGRLLQELFGLGCSNLVCILYMDRGRSLFIFKVKGHISRSLGFYKEFWHLYPCGQDIAAQT